MFEKVRRFFSGSKNKPAPSVAEANVRVTGRLVDTQSSNSSITTLVKLYGESNVTPRVDQKKVSFFKKASLAYRRFRSRRSDDVKHELEIITEPLSDQIGLSRGELNSQNFAGKRVIGIRVNGQLLTRSDLKAVSKDTPRLALLSETLSLGGTIRNKNGKLKLGQSFNLDEKTGMLYFKTPLLGTIRNIGKVTSVDTFEREVFKDLGGVLKAPKIHSINLFALDAHDQALKAKEQMIKECDDIKLFLKERGYSGELTADALQEILNVEKEPFVGAYGKRFQDFLVKAKTVIAGVEHLEDGLQLFTELEEVLNRQAENYTLQDVKLESRFKDMPLQDRISDLLRLKNKINIQTPDFSALSSKIKDYSEKGIIGDVFQKQIEEYIAVTGKVEFNQQIANLYQNGLNSLANIYQLQDSKVVGSELLAHISDNLIQVRDFSHKVNVLLSHVDGQVNDEMKLSLVALRDFATVEASKLCEVYVEKSYDLPYLSAGDVPNLTSVNNFLSHTASNFPQLGDLHEKIAYLQHFADKSGLGKTGQFDQLDPQIKQMIIKHYESGSLIHPRVNSRTYEETISAGYTELFLGKILGPSFTNLDSEVVNSLLGDALSGDFALISDNFLQHAKQNIASKEYGLLAGFIANMALSGNNIATELGEQEKGVEAFREQEIVMLQGLKEAKSTILPFFDVNSLDSIVLSKSLLALREHGIAKIGSDFNLLLVQTLILEAKQETIREQRSKGDFSLDSLNTEMTKNLIKIVANLSEEEKLLLQTEELAKIGLDIGSHGDYGRINKVVTQGFSNTEQVRKMLASLAAVGSVLSNNSEIRSMLLQDLMTNDVGLLSNQIKQRSLSKLFDMNYVAKGQEDGVLASLKGRVHDRIMEQTNNAGIEQRSAAISGMKVGRAVTNLDKRIFNNGVTIKEEFSTSSSKKTETYMAKLVDVADVLNSLGQIMEKERSIRAGLAEEKIRCVNSVGVFMPDASEISEYKSKSHKQEAGKTSARIINNYFLIKNERDHLANIVEHWHDLTEPEADFPGPILSVADVKNKLERKNVYVDKLWGAGLDGGLRGMRMERVNKDGELKSDGEFLGITFSEFRNGAEISKFLGFVSPKNQDLLSSVGNLHGKLDDIAKAEREGPNGKRWITNLQGFNFKNLHRSSYNILGNISKKPSCPTITDLDRLSAPENLHSLKTIENRAYLKNMSEIISWHKESESDHLERNLIRVQDLGAKVVDQASGNFKEAKMMIHVAIMHGYDQLVKEKPGEEIVFSEYLEALLNDELKSQFLLNVASDSPLLNRDSLLSSVGVPKQLDNLCLYELNLVVAASEQERDEILLSWHNDISVSDQSNDLKTEIDEMQDRVGLNDSRLNSLTSQVAKMRVGEQVMVGSDLVSSPIPLSSLMAAPQKLLTGGLASITPEISIYKNSAFTIEKGRDGKVSLIVNQEQGANLQVSLSMMFDTVTVGGGVGYGLDKGVKFEYSGSEAAEDAVRLGRKLLTGKDFSLDDISQAEFVCLSSGAKLDASAAITAGVPSVLEALGVSNSTVCSMSELEEDSAFYDRSAKFTAAMESSGQNKVTERRGVIETSSSKEFVVRVQENEQAISNVLSENNIASPDMFYGMSFANTTTEKNGYIVGHHVVETIALDDDASLSNNEGEYLQYLNQLISANEQDGHLMYDKELIEEIASVIRDNDGTKSIRIERDIRPEELQVINNQLSTSYASGDKESQKCAAKHIEKALSDLSATSISNISISVNSKTSRDATSAVESATGVKTAKYSHVEKHELKRFNELLQDPNSHSSAVHAQQASKSWAERAR